MNRWLLLDSPAAPGAENMALDETLLARAERGALPCLRLYSFAPPAITIGAHQDPSRAVDLGRAAADGIDVVRRVTGGRALLHSGEITYCVAAPLGAPPCEAGPSLAYRRIAEALAAALRAIGIDAAVSRGAEGAPAAGAATPCLSSVSRWELAVRGRKIAGNAQRTSARAFIQHGSILLRPGSESIGRYLPDGCAGLSDRITNVRDELGLEVSARAIREAIVAAFGAAFGIEWKRYDPTDADREEIERRARGRAMPPPASREVAAP